MATTIKAMDSQSVITGVSELGYIQVKVLTPLAKEVKLVTKGAFYLLSKSAGNIEEE